MDVPASRILQQVYAAHVEHFGDPDELWVFDDGRSAVGYPKRLDVLLWRATQECDIATFATIGMSAVPMNGAVHRAELHFALRKQLSTQDERSVAFFLANLAMYPFQIGEFIDWWHTVANPGTIPFATKATCILLHPRFVVEGWDTIVTSEADVHLLNAVPITPEEKSLKSTSLISTALKSIDVFSPR